MSAQPVDVLAVMDAEVATLRRLESWVNEALAPTHADAQTAITNMEQARAAVAGLIKAVARFQAAEEATHNCTAMVLSSRSDEAAALMAEMQSAKDSMFAALARVQGDAA